MTTIVLGSVRGSPGVTTAALLVAGALPGGVVFEADTDGGTLAVRYGLGREPGLTTLLAERTVPPGAWRQHAQVAGGVPVVVGPDSPTVAGALWESAGERAAHLIGDTGATRDTSVVVDAGRLRPSPVVGAIGGVADMLIVLIPPRAEGIVSLAHRLPALRRAGSPVFVVTVGDGPYRPEDVAGQLDVAVLGGLPDDRRAAGWLTGRGGSRRALARTPLGRAASALAAAVEYRLGPASSSAFPSARPTRSGRGAVSELEAPA